MELHVSPEQVPIETDVDGVIRIGGTRVTLDTVMAAFDAGATPEEIVQQYPSVTLADIYSVIAYYLRHQSEIRAYLAQRQRQAAQIREENERHFDPTGVRDRLLARRGWTGVEMFEIIGDITNIQVIATGRGIRRLKNLRKRHGGRRWRKLKGSCEGVRRISCERRR